MKEVISHNVYIHACIHTYIHTYIHLFFKNHIYVIRTYIHTYVHMYIHTYVYVVVHTYIYPVTGIRIVTFKEHSKSLHTYTHIYIHTYLTRVSFHTIYVTGQNSEYYPTLILHSFKYTYLHTYIHSRLPGVWIALLRRFRAGGLRSGPVNAIRQCLRSDRQWSAHTLWRAVMRKLW